MEPHKAENYKDILRNMGFMRQPESLSNTINQHRQTEADMSISYLRQEKPARFNLGDSVKAENERTMEIIR